MTLQDYVTLSQDSINNFFSVLGSSVADIVAAIIVLVVGLVVGYILKRILVEILQAINLEKALGGWSVYQKITKSHDNLDVTNFFGELLRWLAIVVFLIPAVQSLQIVGSENVLLSVLSYVPTVILASLYLLIGFVVAWFVHRAILAVAIVVGNNPSHVVANVAYLSIVIFAGFQALLQLGLDNETIRMLVIATFAAGALALGLGAREQAMELAKKLIYKAK